MTKNNKQTSPFGDLLPILVGEAVVSLLVCLGFGIADIIGVYDFSYRVILGAMLGAVVIIANHAALIVAVDRELKKIIDLRGNKEMSEEEAELFAKKNSASVQNAMRSSFIFRTASIFAALVLAFLLDWFNPLATAIPMFAFRGIITVSEMIKSRHAPKPNPDKFIKYEYNDEENEKEES